MFVLSSGIDLLDINRLADIRPAIRERFIQRVFTPREIKEAKDSNASLSGRFAAKEAVAKALGTGIGKISWQEIEIWSGEDKSPQLALYGEAKSVADELHLTCWSISISHTDHQAVAVAVAVGELPEGE